MKILKNRMAVCAASLMVGLFSFAQEDAERDEISRKKNIIPIKVRSGEILPHNSHPLERKMEVFLERQPEFQGFERTGFNREDYLDVIAGQVRAMMKYQDKEGRIIDPVAGKEKYYTTPCYAHSAAALAAGGRSADAKLIKSGMRAMDIAIHDMVNYRPASNHGDFYSYPIMLALELFTQTKTVHRARVNKWREQLRKVEREKLCLSGPREGNWNVVNLSGEFLRFVAGMGDLPFVELCLSGQKKRFNGFGLYCDTGHPPAYDHYARKCLTVLLHKGYQGKLATIYKDLIWKGAWTSLFMQSPFGELPTGFRSSHHIWNEAEQAVTFEIFATHYANAGLKAEAGAFKRAAHLALQSIKHWIRPDGSGYIVKNRYPIRAKHGYEKYSIHTCYNMWACHMLAQAWQFACDSIDERPAPADTGGFVIPIVKGFRKIFANAGGNYAEYETSGDRRYNPTGLIRIHLKNGHPHLGPSDGCGTKFSGKGVWLSVGPAWKSKNGKWIKLAEISRVKPQVEILKEKPEEVCFQVIYDLSKKRLKETITINSEGVTVEDVVTGDRIEAMRVFYPMLVFDGKNHTVVEMNGNTVRLTLKGKGVSFSVLAPRGLQLKRSGIELKHRNGLIEAAFVEFKGNRAVYRISAVENGNGQ